MICLRLDLPPINARMPGTQRNVELLDYLQMVNDTAPTFNANGHAVRLSLKLQRAIDACRNEKGERNTTFIELPVEVHEMIKVAIEAGPYPVQPARMLEPYNAEIREPESERPGARNNGSTDAGGKNPDLADRAS